MLVVVIISLCKQVCTWLIYISVLEAEAIALRARGLSGQEAWGSLPSMTQSSYYIINFDFIYSYYTFKLIYTWVNFVDTQMTDRIIVT